MVTAAEAVQDVAGVQDGAGEAATEVIATDLENEEKAPGGKKRKIDILYDPYDPDFVDYKVYEYDYIDDVDKGNIDSFIAKEVEKIKVKGSALYFKRKKYVCPYCTTKAKPKDGLYEHLISHARDASMTSDDYKVRGQHVALLKALVPTRTT
ncbi:putative LRR receptor-like serine/threonine-protein kinase [Hordeum vulgare]|nr:putative LRR receptor-like serine/threonine-protein kinase [Hordeum vulgare]